MCSEMNPFIQARSNDRCLLITDVGIIALTFPFALPLPLGAIAVSSRYISIWSVSIMIQLDVVQGGREGRKVGYVIGCV